MTECRVCESKCELFLCQRCSNKLKTALDGLARGHEMPTGKRSPGWLEYLDDAATGQAKLGTGGHRRRGDDEPLRLNLKASRLLAEAHDLLTYWTRDLCDTRRVRWIPIRSVEPGFVGPLRPGWRRLTPAHRATTIDLATWLAAHTTTIASSEHADEIHGEILDLVERIERVINRPRPMRTIGPCPSIVTTHANKIRECGTELTAKQNQDEVQCPGCKNTHNIEQLIKQRIDQVQDWLFTAREISDIMASIGEPIPGSTWRTWRTKDLLIDRSENLSPEPRYWIADIRELRSKNSAHKKKRATRTLEHAK